MTRLADITHGPTKHFLNFSNLAYSVNAIIFRPILNFKLILNATLLALYPLTKSLLYVLKPIACTNYLEINVIQIVVINIK